MIEFENSIWRYYHESSKNKNKGHESIPFDPNKWPDSWKKIDYKSYDRLPKLELPKPVPLHTPLDEILNKRESEREFLSTPLNLIDLSNILHASSGVRGDFDHRPYPSGGGRYPVELYIINIQGSEEFPEGIFHYDFRKNVLDILWKHKFDREELSGMFGYPWAKRASTLVVMSGVFDRTIKKYGERGYRFVLLEAGHIAQNILLASAASNVKACPLGGINEDYFEKIIDFDQQQESIVYSLVLGS